MENKKGFTLIELLAVIVILAIIALIATPIVLNIISESKKAAGITSAQNYINAVEQGVATYLVSGSKIKNGTYKIMGNGDICIGVLSGQSCDGDVLNVDINGETPIAGRVVVKEKTVVSGKLKFNDKNIEKKQDGDFEYIDYIGEYELGETVIFNPGDNINTSWNVINETEKEVTLILDKNLGQPTIWGNEGGNGQEGPISAMTRLNEVTSSWTIDPISNYSYKNELEETKDEYQKIEIKNGVTTITNASGGETQIAGVTKARLITSEELYYLAEQSNSNYSEENIKKYIGENLEQISEDLLSDDQVATSIDNLFELLKIELNSENLILIATNLFIDYGVQYQYDLTLPKYLDQNLSLNAQGLGYWSLSSIYENKVLIPNVVYFDSIYYLEPSIELSVRPVITVNKSLLGGK